ncbi:hypothetical protein [Allohahella marinimesophila]|uniref:Beta-barrel porin 2 n=1 Tax=Allohahella marinimesophila TaxID=1054972 RepID=A0ABP7NV95_9GAMM
MSSSCIFYPYAQQRSLLGSAILLASIVTTPAFAAVLDDLSMSHRVQGEVRYFWQDALYGQTTPLRPSIAWEPEVSWRGEAPVAVYFKGFARENFLGDSYRSHADVRELYMIYEGNNWDVVAGANKVFWGVTESRHLVDVINQSDLVENIDGEDKLGQPMLNLNLQADWGRIAFFILPYFRERTLPDDNDRFRLPLSIDNEALYDSGDEEWHNDFAVRYSHYIESLDFGISYFNGTNREPRYELLLEPPAAAGFPPAASLQARYVQMRQYGLDLQYTVDSWLLKLEAIYRSTAEDDFLASVSGLEYTIYQIFGTDGDLGLLLEYLNDRRDERIDPVQGDDDVFAGLRWAANDIDGTSILGGAVVDLAGGTTFLSIEAERRLRDDLKLEFAVRLITQADEDDSAFALRNDDYAELGLNYYF